MTHASMPRFHNATHARRTFSLLYCTQTPHTHTINLCYSIVVVFKVARAGVVQMSAGANRAITFRMRARALGGFFGWLNTRARLFVCARRYAAIFGQCHCAKTRTGFALHHILHALTVVHISVPLLSMVNSPEKDTQHIHADVHPSSC